MVSFGEFGVLDISNAGRATSKGIEVEGSLSAGRGLQLLGVASWLDAAGSTVPGSAGSAT